MAWSLDHAQALLPSLIGHLLYGAVTAVTYATLQILAGGGADAGRGTGRRQTSARWTGAMLRGLTAAAFTTGALYVMYAPHSRPGLQLPPVAVPLLAGVCYPWLFPARREPAGPALVRGTAYGFLWWLAAVLTLPALLHLRRLDWSHDATLSAAGLLPPYLLLGAGTAVLYSWLTALTYAVLTDDVRAVHRRPPDGRGPRAAAYGAVAGLAGGVLFTVVMVLVGQLPTVAGLVGSQAAATGLVLHLLIAQTLGVSYALLFRRRAFDLLSGIGWGTAYGFLWWVLGALTLFPLLLGGAPHWNAAEIAAAFPSLVGHLGFGAVLGSVYYRLETRTNPWWATRSQVEAERTATAREQTLSSAPALWGLTALIALLLPLLVRP